MKLAWKDDESAERRMKKLGGRWERRSLLLPELDLLGSRMNNARTEPFDVNLAINYAIALLDGDAFPALIVRKPDPGYNLFPILSGNHRAGGVECLVTQGDIKPEEALLDCYILDADPATCELVERAANRWVGRGTSREKAMADVRWMMKRYKLSLEEVAPHFCLDAGWLKSQIRREEQENAMRAEGVEIGRLGIGHRDKLWQLAFNMRLLLRTSQTVIAHNLTLPKTTELVDSVKLAAKKGEQSGIEAIKEYEHHFCRDAALLKPAKTVPSQSAYTPGQRHNYRARFLTHLVGLHNFLKLGNGGKPFETLAALQVTTAAEEHETRLRWRELKRALDGMLRASAAKRSASKKRTNGAVSKSRRKKKGVAANG